MSPPSLIAPVEYVEYEPRLIEEAVREALASGAVALPRALLLRLRIAHRRALDRIYALGPEAEREAAFRGHFRRMFEQLGLEDVVAAGLDELAAWPWRLEGVLLQATDAPQREGAELWEHREHRGSGAPAYLVVHLTPARFRQPTELAAYLQDEVRAAAAATETPSPAATGTPHATAAKPPQQRCPLCGFPTIVWASADLLRRAAPAIAADYPDWLRAEGCCEHCADRYGTRA